MFNSFSGVKVFQERSQGCPRYTPIKESWSTGVGGSNNQLGPLHRAYELSTHALYNLGGLYVNCHLCGYLGIIPT